MQTVRTLSVLAAVTLAQLGCDPPPKRDMGGGDAGAKKPASTATAKSSAAAPEVDVPLLHDLGEIKFPDDNEQSDAKVKLGHQLFFDPRLSADGELSCYSCHQNEDGTGGHDPMAVGANGKQLTRHAPVMWNVAYLPELYWDGRAKSLEEQGMAAWKGGNMGVGDEGLDAKVKEIAEVEAYKKQFDDVFGEEGVTAENIIKAIAAYERTLVCNDTKYDKYAKGDKSAFNDVEKKGLGIFMGKGACTVCHTPPHFSAAYGASQGVFYNVGIGTKDKKDDEVDIGRNKVSEADTDWGAFKVPTLRNISKSAPYFHDGSVDNLEEAVRLMAGGGIDNKNKNALVQDRKLSDDEIAALIAFLETLECGGKLEKPELP